MLKLSRDTYSALRAHGDRTYPHECCGAMLGRFEGDDRVVAEVIACGNTRDDRPQDRFNISPGELVRIQRQGREKGLDIVGFYHSHPDHPAQWSQTDFAEAHWIGCSYVITSVEKGHSTVTNSFLLTGDGEESKHFENEEIRVE
jgi:proteasome lid subunit RPN8/RPN11